MWPQLMTGDGSQPRTVPICIEIDQKAIFFHPTKTHQISPTFVRQDLCGRTARMSSGRGGRGQWGDPESSQMKATEHFFWRLGNFNDHPSVYGKSYICCAPVPVGGYSD